MELKMDKQEIKKLMKDIPNTCHMCIHIARTHEWARQNKLDIWGHRQITPYLAEIASNGYEYGCEPKCPFLDKSIMLLG